MTSTDVPAIRRGDEPALVLDLEQAPPRPLGFGDQAVMWASLGVSLLIPAAALFVLFPVPGGPALTVGAALLAIVVGSAAGSLLLGAAAAPGARTGAPAMALLRGLLGRRTSYLPTALNLLQCFGWAALEVYVIAAAATALTSPSWRPLWVLVGGGVATLMAMRPIAVVKVLRRYLGWLVLFATVVLFVDVLRAGVPSGVPGADWSGFWPAFDVVVALPVSWAPLAADYSRHSRSGRAAFSSAALGYGAASAAYFVLGLLAVLTVGGLDQAFTPTSFVTGLLALPLGAVALLILLVDEVDEAFANIYSTTMSTQNLLPHLDRRLLAALIGLGATLTAMWVDLLDYQSFLLLIGALFVPLAVVLVTDYYAVRRLVLGRSGAGYDVVRPGPGRWLLVLPWLAGFAAYNLVNPGLVPWWADRWLAWRDSLGLVPPTWLSASVAAAAVAFVTTLAVSVPLAVRLRGAVPAVEGDPVPAR